MNTEAFKTKVLAAQFASVLSAVNNNYNNEVTRMILEDIADNTHEHLRRPKSKNGNLSGGWWG